MIICRCWRGWTCEEGEPAGWGGLSGGGVRYEGGVTSYVGGAGSFVAALGERAVVVDGGLSEQLAARGNDLSDALWSARLLADAPEEVDRKSVV